MSAFLILYLLLKYTLTPDAAVEFSIISVTLLSVKFVLSSNILMILISVVVSAIRNIVNVDGDCLKWRYSTRWLLIPSGIVGLFLPGSYLQMLCPIHPFIPDITVMMWWHHHNYFQLYTEVAKWCFGWPPRTLLIQQWLQEMELSLAQPMLELLSEQFHSGGNNCEGEYSIDVPHGSHRVPAGTTWYQWLPLTAETYT